VGDESTTLTPEKLRAAWEELKTRALRPEVEIVHPDEYARRVRKYDHG